MDTKEKSETVFKAFLELIGRTTSNDETILDLVKKFYSQTNPHFLWSEGFVDLVGIYSGRIENESSNVYIHIKGFADELKSYKAKPLKHLINKRQSANDLDSLSEEHLIKKAYPNGAPSASKNSPLKGAAPAGKAVKHSKKPGEQNGKKRKIEGSQLPHENQSNQKKRCFYNSIPQPLFSQSNAPVAKQQIKIVKLKSPIKSPVKNNVVISEVICLDDDDDDDVTVVSVTKVTPPVGVANRDEASVTSVEQAEKAMQAAVALLIESDSEKDANQDSDDNRNAETRGSEAVQNSVVDLDVVITEDDSARIDKAMPAANQEDERESCMIVDDDLSEDDNTRIDKKSPVKSPVKNNVVISAMNREKEKESCMIVDDDPSGDDNTRTDKKSPVKSPVKNNVVISAVNREKEKESCMIVDDDPSGDDNTRIDKAMPAMNQEEEKESCMIVDDDPSGDDNTRIDKAMPAMNQEEEKESCMIVDDDPSELTARIDATELEKNESGSGKKRKLSEEVVQNNCSNQFEELDVIDLDTDKQDGKTNVVNLESDVTVQKQIELKANVEDGESNNAVVSEHPEKSSSTENSVGAMESNGGEKNVESQICDTNHGTNHNANQEIVCSDRSDVIDSTYRTNLGNVETNLNNEALDKIEASNKSSIIPSTEPMEECSGMDMVESNEVPTSHQSSDGEIAKLEMKLKRLRDLIEETELKEDSIESLDTNDSYYLLASRCKRKFVSVWKKLCKLTNRPTSTGRPIERKFKFRTDRYRRIGQNVSQWINKTREFPDYQDVLEIVMNCNSFFDMKLSSSLVNDLAKEAFTDVGNLLQQCRKDELRRHMDDICDPSYLPPIEPELIKKLDKSLADARTKMNKVIDKFAEEQKEKEASEGKLAIKNNEAFDKENAGEMEKNSEREGEVEERSEIRSEEELHKEETGEIDEKSEIEIDEDLHKEETGELENTSEMKIDEELHKENAGEMEKNSERESKVEKKSEIEIGEELHKEETGEVEKKSEIRTEEELHKEEAGEVENKSEIKIDEELHQEEAGRVEKKSEIRIDEELHKEEAGRVEKKPGIINDGEIGDDKAGEMEKNAEIRIDQELDKDEAGEVEKNLEIKIGEEHHKEEVGEVDKNLEIRTDDELDKVEAFEEKKSEIRNFEELSDEEEDDDDFGDSSDSESEDGFDAEEDEMKANGSGVFPKNSKLEEEEDDYEYSADSSDSDESLIISDDDDDVIIIEDDEEIEMDSPVAKKAAAINMAGTSLRIRHVDLLNIRHFAESRLSGFHPRNNLHNAGAVKGSKCNSSDVIDDIEGDDDEICDIQEEMETGPDLPPCDGTESPSICTENILGGTPMLLPECSKAVKTLSPNLKNTDASVNQVLLPPEPTSEQMITDCSDSCDVGADLQDTASSAELASSAMPSEKPDVEAPEGDFLTKADELVENSNIDISDKSEQVTSESKVSDVVVGGMDDCGDPENMEVVDNDVDESKKTILENFDSGKDVSDCVTESKAEMSNKMSSDCSTSEVITSELKGSALLNPFAESTEPSNELMLGHSESNEELVRRMSNSDAGRTDNSTEMLLGLSDSKNIIPESTSSDSVAEVFTLECEHNSKISDICELRSTEIVPVPSSAAEDGEQFADDLLGTDHPHDVEDVDDRLLDDEMDDISIRSPGHALDDRLNGEPSEETNYHSDLDPILQGTSSRYEGTITADEKVAGDDNDITKLAVRDLNEMSENELLSNNIHDVDSSVTSADDLGVIGDDASVV